MAKMSELPDGARVWVFGSQRSLSESESASLLEQVDGFLETWNAHGAPLTAAREWMEGRFLVIAADEVASAPSGCSIDALMGVLKDFESQTSVRFLGNEAVWYRTGADVQRATRPEFRALAKAGTVSSDVTVYDTSITRLQDLRDGTWNRPARAQWHGPAFFPV